MNILYSISNFKNDNETAVLIGAFDGVHKGHKKVISEFKKIALKKNNMQTTIITFSPCPKLFFDKTNKFKQINTLNENISILKDLEINNLIIEPFNEKIINKTYIDFFENYLRKYINIKEFVMGYDQLFGKEKQGNFNNIKELLKTKNINTLKLNKELIDNITISSTKVREFILKGEIERVNYFLGYNFFLEGEVVKGNKIGSKIGFPTANLKIDEKKIIPKNGVYFTKTIINNREYNSIINIGIRPTLGINGDKTIEVHILDFNENIYAKKLKLNFISKIRNEKKFANLEALKEQIKKDLLKIKNK